jgi:phosphoribosylamine--glycine ligase
VLTSPGYPEAPRPAEPRGDDQLAGAVAFRGGPSGRVLTVSALGDTLAEARARAYAAVESVDLPGGHFRRDIALHDRAQ